jgi:hypothetical protein
MDQQQQFSGWKLWKFIAKSKIEYIFCVKYSWDSILWYGFFLNIDEACSML